MKLAPSSVGAEPKKLALLGAILVIGGVVYWLENRSDSSVSANVAPAPIAAAPAPIEPLPSQAGQNQPTEPKGESAAHGLQNSSVDRSTPLGGSGSDTWIPSMKKPDDLDVSKVDPRIDLELLARVRAVPLEGGSSSLFDYSKPPEPPTPPVAKIVPAPVPVPPPAAASKGGPAGAPKAATPPSPPIPFKYYGYAGKPAAGALQGLFIEGDPTNGTIYAKSEGEMIQDRYKILHIGIRSADVEDTQTHHQETLKMPADQQ